MQFNGFNLPVSKPCVIFPPHSPDEDSSQKFIPFIGVCVHLQWCFIVWHVLFLYLAQCICFQLVCRWWKWGLLNKLLPHLVSYTVNILYIKYGCQLIWTLTYIKWQNNSQKKLIWNGIVYWTFRQNLIKRLHMCFFEYNI